MPTPQPRKTRIAVLAIGVSLLVVATTLLLLPRLLAGWGVQAAQEAAAGLGLSLEVGSVLLRSFRTVDLSDVCLTEAAPHDAGPRVCLGQTRLSLGPGDLLAGRPGIERVHVRGGYLDLTAAAGTPEEFVARLQALANREPRPRQEPRPTRERQTRRLEATVEGFEVRLDGQPLPLDGVTLSSVTVEVDGDIHVEGALALRDFRLPAPLESTPLVTLNVTADIPADGEPHVELDPIQPFSISSPSVAPGVDLEFDKIGFRAPWTLTTAGVRVRALGQVEPIAEIETAELDVQAWVTRLEDLHLARLRLDGPVLRLILDRDGRPRTPAGLPGHAAEEGSGAGTMPAEEAEGSGAFDAGSADGIWADREWWEIVPPVIEVHGGRLHVERELPTGERRRAELRDLEVEWALRILRFQMDAESSGALALDGTPAGRFTLNGAWGYRSENLTLRAELTDIDLALLSVVAPPGWPLAAGVLSTSIEWEDAEGGPGLDASGWIALERATLPAPLVDEPLDIARLRADWQLSRDEVDGVVVTRLARGDLALGEATMSVTGRATDARIDGSLPFSRLDLTLDVPRQPAMQLWSAVPEALRRGLEGTSMGGEFGLHLELPVTLAVGEQGAVTAEVGPAEEVRVEDDTLTLEAMPEAVDPRRLNGAFQFRFEGAEGSTPRDIEVPRSPGRSAPEIPDAPVDSVPDPSEAPDWARLDQISYYLIAMQLYREDGSFFRNTGINWFQLRRVIEEAIEQRAFGRGASTISMQLVKNVLLTHERSIRRKLQELFLTYWMTRTVPKERLLEIYLNVIEWGPGINGIVEASRHYFGVEPADLTLSQATWLSAITPAPLRRAVQFQRGAVPDWMWEHCQDLIRGLAGRGFISNGEMALGLSSRPVFRGTPQVVDTSLSLPPGELGAEPAPANGTVAGIAIAPAEEEAATGSLASLPLPQRIEALIATARPLRGDGVAAPVP